MINARTTVSVGASGAIMGLFAAMLVLSCRFAAPTRGRLRITAIQVLVASMLPIASDELRDGRLRRPSRRRHRRRRRRRCCCSRCGRSDATGRARHRPRSAVRASRSSPLLIAAIGVAGAAYGATRVPYDHKLQSYAALLFPRDRLPATDDAAKSAAAGLIATHPRDPRGHFYHALALIDAKNLSDAESELRTALGDGELLQMMFKPAFAQRLETLLSLVLLEQRKTADARATAAPVCALATPSATRWRNTACAASEPAHLRPDEARMARLLACVARRLIPEAVVPLVAKTGKDAL